MDLHTIDEALFAIWKEVWHLGFLQPANLAEERERFFASDNHMPQFVYKALPFDTDALKGKLESLKKRLEHYQGEVIGRLLLQKTEKLLSWLGMLASRGTEEFTTHAIAYYGKPDAELLEQAKTLLPLEGERMEATIGSARAVTMLQKEADKLGLGCRVVERSGLASRADCVLPKKTLYIREGATFSERDVQKLAVHELGVHARRAMNGTKRKWKLFIMGTAEYETTEEGLAGVMEERAGVSSDNSLKTKGGLVLGVHHALNGSFRDVYAYLRGFFAAESAYRIAFRVKRGLGDTAKPGAFTKDLIYLKGLTTVRELASETIEQLFVGRVAVEDLEALQSLGLASRAT